MNNLETVFRNIPEPPIVPVKEKEMEVVIFTPKQCRTLVEYLQKVTFLPWEDSDKVRLEGLNHPMAPFRFWLEKAGNTIVITFRDSPVLMPNFQWPYHAFRIGKACRIDSVCLTYRNYDFNN